MLPRKKYPLERPRWNMTPMIDVVFLLLTFFVTTFRIIVPEGDFNVNMIRNGAGVQGETKKNVRVSLKALPNGDLAAILLDETPIPNFTALRAQIRGLAAADLEVELAPDDGLHYCYVVDAVSSISGEIVDGQVKKICSRIKFVKIKP